jgi:hypothetical protein
MCKGKPFCSRDSWLTDSGYWEAVAWNYICKHHRDWCGGPDDSVFVSASAFQESGVGSAVKALLPKALTTGYNSGNGVIVYVGIRNGKDVYVGITNNLARRTAEHGGKYILRPVTRTPVTRGEARAIEQALILRNPHFANVRNSISPKHPYYQRAVQWGEAWLKSNG